MNFDDLDPEGAAATEEKVAAIEHAEEAGAAIKRFTEIILERAINDASAAFTTRLAQNIEDYFADNKATRNVTVDVQGKDIFVTIKLQEKDLKKLLFTY